MLISHYLSSNIIICILFLIWSILKTYLGQKWRNIFVRFLVQMMKTSKFAFEIIWPLVIWLKKHLILKKGCGLTDIKQREYLCVQIRIEKYTTLWLQYDSIWMKDFFIWQHHKYASQVQIQYPRAHLNKKFLPRPKTTTAP